MFAFVRHWARRSTVGDEVADQGRLVLVVEAVQALARRGIPATVNAVAREIGLDQSGASRLLAAAATAGHLVSALSAADGRHRVSAVTASGAALLASAHVWQEAEFSRLTAGWSARRRDAFARDLAELLTRSSGTA
jgi:DNA-binding MarR family transcriptional regulator